MAAAPTDHSERIELNATNKHGETAFTLVCKSGYTEVVKLLLDHSKRIELNAPDNYGETALMWACRNGHKYVVKLLLEHADQRIDLNAKNYNGNTALMIAHYRGHQDIVQMIEAKLSFIQLQNKTEDYDLGLKKAKEEIGKQDREPKPSTQLNQKNSF